MTLHVLHRIITSLLLLPLFFIISFGQSRDHAVEVNDIDITIDGPMTKQEVLNQLTTLETPWSPLIFLNENIYQKIGAPREYFDPSLFKQDINHLKSYLRDNGYFRADIDTSLTFSSDNRSVDIGIVVRMNDRSMIDTLKILGLETIPPEIVNSIMQKGTLKRGDPYVKKMLWKDNPQS